MIPDLYTMMRFLSLFRWQQRGWLPFTNIDDETTGLDDLMRLAEDDESSSDEDEELEPEYCGATFEDSYLLVDASRYNVNDRINVTRSSLHTTGDFQAPVFSRQALTESHSSNRHASPAPFSQSQPTLSLPFHSTSSWEDHHDAFSQEELEEEEEDNSNSSRCRRGTLCGTVCLCNIPRASFPKSRPCLLVLSILAPLLCMGLCAGLGVYSLLVYKTDKLVIDKSVKSFSIPNHKVYKDFEAMMLARRDNTSAGKYKRDISSAPDSGSFSYGYGKNFEKSLNLDTTFLSRPKRAALLRKESQMLKKTQEVLRDTSLEGRMFLNKRNRRSADPLTLSTKEDRDEPGSKGFIADVLHRIKRRSHSIGCLFEYQSIARWKMHVIYLAQGDEDHNMFTKERLETVHNIERQIMNHPGFHNFCLRDPNIENYDPSVRGMHGCVPLNSLMTYFFPSKDTEGRIFYDGMGSNIDDIDSALNLAMNHETFYYYVDEKINKTFKKSHLIRSEVLFGAPLPGFSCIGGIGNHNEMDEKFKDFVITYIDLLSTVSTEKVHVLYGGKEIFDYEVTATFWSDIRLATISLIAIFALMLVLTLSLYLTVLGIIIIALSFPISLFFYRVVFEINALGILTGAAVFVIIGIGVDDVFVFVNIYRQASHMSNPVNRIKYTVKTAGVATFFTSFTTAAAFAANLASSIPAVYDFGLFMALIVSSCWVSVFILMPPLLYFHACCVEPLETLLFSCFSCMARRMTMGDDVHEEEPMEAMPPLVEEEVGLYQDDDDVPMLDVQGPNESQDEHLLNVADDDNFSDEQHHHAQRVTLNSNTANNNNMCLGRIIQRCVMFLTNRIVLPGRHIVIAFFVLLLTVSCFLMSQLKPATHPPQLFRPDTNLQRLLDLKANFTIIDALHCDRCSGLYKVHPSPSHRANMTPPTPPNPLPDSVPTPPSLPAPPILTTPTIPDSLAKQAESRWGAPAKTYISSNPVNKPDERSDTDDLEKTSGVESQRNDESRLINQSLSDLADHSSSLPLKLISYALSHAISKALSPSNGGEGNRTMNTRNFSDSMVSASHNATSPIPTTPTPSQGKTWHLPFHKRGDPNKTNGYQESRRTQRPWYPPQSGGSLAENFNVCNDQRCNNLKDRPLMESGTTVYVVFGIAGLHREDDDEGHVMDLFKGRAVFDPTFAEAFDIMHLKVDHIRELCRVCHILSNMTDLIKEGSAQCLPIASSLYKLRHFLATIDECRDLPSSLSVYKHQAPAHAEGGMDHKGRLLWLAFAFESTTKEGLAYSKAYQQYLKWEEVIQHIKDNVLAHDSPLRSIFQTSEFWTKVMMEVVAVNSAIYGLVLSMVICIISVAVFTGHLVLLVIVVVTIIVMICCVVGIFYLAGWEMGAVEAVSLSILVGSSVDYCVHIVEGYILAGRRMDSTEIKTQSAKELRRIRTSQAVRHIGVAIVCSGLTTIMAAIPLTQTFIQPFTKFGSILLINTTVSMLLTLTLATALLATFGPARFRGTWRSHLVAFALVVTTTGLAVLLLFVLSKAGVHIPGPSGSTLFS